MIYYIYLLVILFLYTLSFYGYVVFPDSRLFQIISMMLFFIMSIWYMVRNRKNTLFCPEIIIIIIGFVITFFDILVLNNVGYISGLFTQFTADLLRKSTCLSMIGFSTLFLGEEFARSAYLKKANRIRTGFHRVPTDFALPMHYLVLLILVVVFVSGQYEGFMKYTSEEGVRTNMINIIISIVVMVSSVLEFFRLQACAFRIKTRFSFKHNINKVYVANIMIWSLFLLLTGNRGDMMLIAFPPIILYFFLIRKIGNKFILLGAAFGTFAMIIIGYTRQGESSFSDAAAELGLYGIFRDYGAAHVTQQGLIQYTDAHGTYGYGAGVRAFASSVPFLGGMLVGEHNSESEGNTNILTREQFQLKNIDSGLGTSLLGDLYYAGGIPFVVFYMFVLGWVLSFVYERLYNGKSLNFFLFFTYCWLFADSLYVLRAPYYHLFRQIGFSVIIYYILYVLLYSNSSNQRKISSKIVVK